MLPEMEELVLGIVLPDALGKKILLSMLAKKGREDSTSAHTERHESVSVTRRTAWIAALCPNVKILGLNIVDGCETTRGMTLPARIRPLECRFQ